jgi:phosphohistidine phosphatase
MELYLVQHGESKPEAEDASRPLTASGRREVERVARHAAARLPLDVEEIFHSGKLRARQTAEILAGQLIPTRGPSEMPGLAPRDDPAFAAGALRGAAASTVLVGHLPHLSRLASLLLTGEPDREVVAFRMGALVCLTREDGAEPGAGRAAGGDPPGGASASAPAFSAGWRLRWILTPELAQG